jgi:regulatory protein
LGTSGIDSLAPWLCRSVIKEKEGGQDGRTPELCFVLALFLYFTTCLPHSSLVFSSARQVETESELYQAAQLALMRRPHSVHEMKKLLARRCSNDLLVQMVMARLRENGLIDDARYAKQFARQRTEIRRQGRYRIARDLRARGVPDRHIESALADARDDDAERAAIRQRIERKRKLTARNAGGQIDDRKIASLYRSLLRAGFPSDAIRRELKSLTSEGLPEPDQE